MAPVWRLSVMGPCIEVASNGDPLYGLRLLMVNPCMDGGC